MLLVLFVFTLKTRERVMEDNVPKVRDSCVLPKRYDPPTKKEIVICFGEHELEIVRWTHEPISNFIEVLQVCFATFQVTRIPFQSYKSQP